MPSPFDKLTESDKMRNFVETRPYVESLAQSNKGIFDSEMSRLNLTEKQDEIQQKSLDSQAIARFNSEVVSKSNDPNQLLELSKQFLSDPQNATSSKAITDYSRGVEGLFASSTKYKQDEVALERSKFALEQDRRDNEVNAALQEKRKRISDDTATLNQITTNTSIVEAKLKQAAIRNMPIDSFIGLASLIDTSTLPEPLQEQVKMISDFYGNEINKSSSEDGRILLSKEAEKVLMPLNTFRKNYDSLSNNWARKNLKQISYIKEKYEGKIAQWTKTQIDNGAKPESLTIDKFLLSLNKDKLNPNTIGYEINKNDDGAEMLEDLSRLDSLRTMNASYLASLQGAFTQVNGATSYDRNKVTTIRTNAMRMEDLMGEEVKRLDANTKFKENELKRQKAEVSVQNTQARTGAIADGQQLQAAGLELGAKYRLLSTTQSQLNTQMGINAKKKTTESKKELDRLQGVVDSLSGEIKDIESSIRDFKSPSPDVADYDNVRAE